MAATTLYVIAYDIADAGRLRRALAAVKGYASGGQRSVHECFLTRAEKAALMRALARVIDARADSVVFVRPDPRAGTRTLGIAEPPREAAYVYFG